MISSIRICIQTIKAKIMQKNIPKVTSQEKAKSPSEA
jgi:hypothetical protein